MNTEETRLREIKGLLKACKMTDSKTGIIITLEQEETITMNEVKIEVIAAWKRCAQAYDLYGLL